MMYIAAAIPCQAIQLHNPEKSSVKTMAPVVIQANIPKNTSKDDTKSAQSKNSTLWHVMGHTIELDIRKNPWLYAGSSLAALALYAAITAGQSTTVNPDAVSSISDLVPD